MAGPFQLLGLQGLRGLTTAVEPACPTHLSRAVLGCFGLLGYSSYWDKLVPAWVAPVSLILGFCIAIIGGRLTWFIRGRWSGSIRSSTVEVVATSRTVPLIDHGSRDSASELPLPSGGQSVSRVRRGRGTLA